MEHSINCAGRWREKDCTCGSLLRAENQQLRGLLLWALYHSQGGSSPVGQPIRRVLGIDTHARLTEEEVVIAKMAAESAMALKSAEDRELDSWCPSA